MELAGDLVPLLTFALGAILAELGSLLRDRRLADREGRAFRRQLERDERTAARDFERETLLALQDAVQRFSRMVGRAHFDAEVQVRRDGVSPADLRFPDDVDQGLLETGTELSRLTARVQSADVAGWIGRMRKDADEATSIGIGGRDLAHAREHMDAFADEIAEVHKAIGDRLRTLIYGTSQRSDVVPASPLTPRGGLGGGPL